MGEQTSLFTMDEYQKIVRDYRCNRCYGPLITRFVDNRMVEVYCNNPDCDGNGFVTKAHVERMKSQNIGDYWEAKMNLASVLGIEQKKSSIDDLMRSIGL